MTFGTVTSDAQLVQSGVLAVHVVIGRQNEPKQILVPDTPAARCIERDDTLGWLDNGAVYWSNRARTVRDIPLAEPAKAPLSPRR